MSEKENNINDVVQLGMELKEIGEKDISPVLSFKIGILMDTINPILSNYDKAYAALVNKYSEEDPKDSKNRVIPEKKVSKFVEEKKKLHDEKVILDNVKAIKLSELNSEYENSGTKFKPKFMLFLTKVGFLEDDV